MKKASVALLVFLIGVGVIFTLACKPEDTEPPRITSIEVKESPTALHSEVSGDIIKGEVLVVVKAADNVGIDSVRFFVNDTAWVVDTALTSPDAGTTDQYTYHWNTMQLKDSVVYSIGTKAYDPSGNMAVSKILTYLVRIPNNPPDKATLLTPDANAVIQAAIQAFRWLGYDPDTLPPQAVLYDVYFGTSASNLELVAKDLPHLEGAEPGGDTVNTWSTGQMRVEDEQFYLHPKTDYYWMILTKDPYGQKTPTPVLKFTRGQNRDPYPTALQDRSDTAMFIEYPPSGEITLRWQSSYTNDPSVKDQDGDPVKYSLYFGEDPGKTPVYAADLPVVTPPITDTTGLSTSDYTVKVAAGKTYFWRPIGKDMWGATRDSSTEIAWRIVVE